MPFKKFTLEGTEYPFGHLNSFDVIVEAKDPLQAPARLRVTFSHHVFSVKWDDAKHTEDHEYVCYGERRAFCPVRYGCSIGLRAIVEYHIAGKAYLTRDGNGVWNHLFYAEADGIQYPVFFRLGKADRIDGVDGILHIISAYQNADLPTRSNLQSVKFARLVHQTCPPK